SALQMTPHHVPLLALQAEGISVGILAPSARLLWSRDRTSTWLALVGDDDGPDGSTVGPTGFHRRDLESLLREATHIAVYSASGDPRPYAVFALAAGLGGRVVVIETQVGRHDEWVAEAKRLSSVRVVMQIHPSPLPDGHPWTKL